MILDAAREHKGVLGVFLREDGRPVRWVRKYDDATHEWEAFRIDPREAEARGIPLRSILYRGRCKLTFRQTGFAPPPKAPSRPSLAPRRGGVLLPPGSLDECESPKCHRRAVWYTQDTEETEAEKGADGKDYRTVSGRKGHVFCDDCYRLPTHVDARGVENEVQVKVRPEWKSL